MGIPSADFGPFLAFVFLLGGFAGAIAIVLFLFAPLPWSFYGGLVVGVGAAIAARFAWLWFTAVDFEGI